MNKTIKKIIDKIYAASSNAIMYDDYSDTDNVKEINQIQKLLKQLEKELLNDN